MRFGGVSFSGGVIYRPFEETLANRIFVENKFFLGFDKKIFVANLLILKRIKIFLKKNRKKIKKSLAINKSFINFASQTQTKRQTFKKQTS